MCLFPGNHAPLYRGAPALERSRRVCPASLQPQRFRHRGAVSNRLSRYRGPASPRRARERRDAHPARSDADHDNRARPHAPRLDTQSLVLVRADRAYLRAPSSNAGHAEMLSQQPSPDVGEQDTWRVGSLLPTRPPTIRPTLTGVDDHGAASAPRESHPEVLLRTSPAAGSKAAPNRLHLGARHSFYPRPFAENVARVANSSSDKDGSPSNTRRAAGPIPRSPLDVPRSRGRPAAQPRRAQGLAAAARNARPHESR